MVKEKAALALPGRRGPLKDVAVLLYTRVLGGGTWGGRQHTEHWRIRHWYATTGAFAIFLAQTELRRKIDCNPRSNAFKQNRSATVCFSSGSMWLSQSTKNIIRQKLLHENDKNLIIRVHIHLKYMTCLLVYTPKYGTYTDKLERAHTYTLNWTSSMH